MICATVPSQTWGSPQVHRPCQAALINFGVFLVYVCGGGPAARRPEQAEVGASPLAHTVQKRLQTHCERWDANRQQLTQHGEVVIPTVERGLSSGHQSTSPQHQLSLLTQAPWQHYPSHYTPHASWEACALNPESKAVPHGVAPHPLGEPGWGPTSANRSAQCLAAHWLVPEWPPAATAHGSGGGARWASGPGWPQWPP